jgi:hypothetical protein
MYVFNSYNEIYYHIDKYLLKKQRKNICIILLQIHTHNQCPDEIVPNKSTSTTLRNPSLAHKHDSAGSLLLKTNQLNRVYM